EPAARPAYPNAETRSANTLLAAEDDATYIGTAAWDYYRSPRHLLTCRRLSWPAGPLSAGDVVDATLLTRRPRLKDGSELFRILRVVEQQPAAGQLPELELTAECHGEPVAGRRLAVL